MIIKSLVSLPEVPVLAVGLHEIGGVDIFLEGYLMDDRLDFQV